MDHQNDLRICPECHVVGEFLHHPDDVPEACPNCGGPWFIWRLVKIPTQTTSKESTHGVG